MNIWMTTSLQREKLMDLCIKLKYDVALVDPRMTKHGVSESVVGDDFIHWTRGLSRLKAGEIIKSLRAEAGNGKRK